MNLPKKLLHNCSITPLASLDAYGDKVYSTTIESQQCVFFGGKKRLMDAQGEIIQLGYSAIFLPTATMGVDFLISNVLNKNGTTLLSSGIVVNCELVDKPKSGAVFWDVWIVSGQ